MALTWTCSSRKKPQDKIASFWNFNTQEESEDEGVGQEEEDEEGEELKTTHRIIEDHKPLVEDLQCTGQELMEMCTEEDASDIKEDLDHVNAKYDEAKIVIREKLNDIDEALRNATTDVGETIDGLLEELHYINNSIEHADPVAANPDQIKEQLIENNTLLEDLERKIPIIAKARDTVKELFDSPNPENPEDYEDLRSKLHELDALQANIIKCTKDRDDELGEAYGIAEKFNSQNGDVIRQLRDIHDNLVSQDSPGVDPATVKEQQKELWAIQEELEHVVPAVEGCRTAATDLEKACGTPGGVEIQKHIEDMEAVLEDINEGIKDRKDELDLALEKSDRFDQLYRGIMSWLPKAESKLTAMPSIASDPRSVRIQIEELKVFNMQVKPQYVEIQNLNQVSSDLKSASPVTSESLTPLVKDVNNRWANILQILQDRESTLKITLVTLGEVDHAIDDVLGNLQQTEADVHDLENVFGDPKSIETYLKKLQYVLKDLKNQQSTIDKLDKAVEKMVLSSGTKSGPIIEKCDEMKKLHQNVQLLAKDKKNQLHDLLKEAKAFMGDMEDLIRYMNNFKSNLRNSQPMGALPETAEKQYENFMKEFKELEQKEEEVQTMLLNGEDMLLRCREKESSQFVKILEKMKEKSFDTKEKAQRKRRKIEVHLNNVKDFHAMLKVHTNWLNDAEIILGSFKHPSKLVERVMQQIQEHKNFRQDIEAHRNIMMNLDRTGTYLKYFGRKQDTVYIKNLLISIKLRWKKLVRRADEKGRILQQA